jgi:hypothetical protein
VSKTVEERAFILDKNPLLRELLIDTIGLRDPDPSDRLHGTLIDTLIDLGPGATLGQRVVALRYVFNWELVEAGKEFATAKTKYENLLTRQKVIELAKEKMSVAKAEIFAEGSDGAFELKLKYLLAEQRERAMRKFLDTLDAALENHRTDRADQRSADTYHGRTGT